MRKRRPVPAQSEPQTDVAVAPREERDMVFVGDRAEEGGGYRVLRQRKDRVELGELRELRSGKPITGEVVRLHPTEEHERLFDCEVLHEVTPAPPRKPGPAIVATSAYRRHWDEIFGSDSELN